MEVAQDLTGRVFKADTYPFAYGGSGDIWKAILVQKHSGNTMEVQT
jgi:hypothetical protein